MASLLMGGAFAAAPSYGAHTTREAPRPPRFTVSLYHYSAVSRSVNDSPSLSGVRGTFFFGRESRGLGLQALMRPLGGC